MTRLPPDAAQRPPRDPLIGSLLQGRYRVLRRIGKGGMGVVYLAEHVLIRKRVAIKTLHANPPAAPAVVERFHREALAATAIGDEHVVDVTDMGQLDDGAYYLVMEYLEGADLAWTVASAGALPIARAVRIVVQLCDALTAVHAAGIVHRDLKPENLFLVERRGERDFVKVLDFGVCKLTQPTEGYSYHRLTGTGAALGTPHFMAPEQIEGRPDIDHRADLYAVGGILFHALTGNAPFDAPSLPRLFMRICNDPPPPLRDLRPDVPEALELIVQKTLAKDPNDRFANSEELKAALLPFAERGDGDDGNRTDPEFDELPRPSALARAAVTDVEWVTLEARRRWPVRAVLTGVLLAVVALAASVWRASDRPEASGERAIGGGPARRATRLVVPSAETVPARAASVVVQSIGHTDGVGEPKPAAEAEAGKLARPKRAKISASEYGPADTAVEALPSTEVIETEAQPPAAAPAPAALTTTAAPSEQPLLPHRELKHVF